jgi:hypothetical protein
MSMWRWRKVRRATITETLRTEFERYGELVLAHALAAASPVTPLVGDLQKYTTEDRAHLMAWLTERRDIGERKADRTEARDVAILVFAGIAAVTGVIGIVMAFIHPAC